MRGTSDPQTTMLSTLTPDSLIPPDHPIRRIKKVVEAVLTDLDPEFDAMYATTGRHSVPPEQLLKSSVLMALYSIRSERQFCERLQYDMLFKFFLDLNIDAEAFDHSTFSRNRERLLEHEIADRFFAAVVRQAHLRRYRSGEHFSVDGTLLEAWASHKSFRPKDGGKGGGPSGPGRNAEVDFHGMRRSNETHQSTTDPEARLARKGDGQPAKLSYAGHLLMEHRSALITGMELTPATGYAERETALQLLRRLPRMARRRTVAADKAYDTRDFVAGCRGLGITPHVAQNDTNRSSAIDGRTTRHEGHVLSLRIRKRIEEPIAYSGDSDHSYRSFRSVEPVAIGAAAKTSA
jgi:transposase